MNKAFGIFWAAAGMITAMPALAAPPVDVDGLVRNGALSRMLWAPDAGRQDLLGLRVSAGLAIGLNEQVQAQMRRNLTPSLAVEMGHGSHLAILPGGRRGTMLVWHLRH